MAPSDDSDHAASDSDFSDCEGSEFAEEPTQSKKRPAPTSPLPSPTRPKRARTTQSSKPARKGKAKAKAKVKIDEFPLDVLYEILSYTGPVDLLSMSRVNTSLRDALTTKSSRFVWKNAIANVKLPPCPEDISEIHYAHFALDPYCDYCHSYERKRELLYYDYYSRQKTCKGCAETEFENVYYWGEYYHSVPMIKIQRRNRGGISVDFRANSKKMKELNKKLKSLRRQAAREEWVKQRKAEADKLYKLEGPLTSWFRKEVAKDDSKKKDLRQTRLNDIFKKLTEEGWAEELNSLKKGHVDGMHTFQNLRNVKLAANLSQKAWEKMKPDLVLFMQDVREKRLARNKRLEETRVAQDRRRRVDRALPLLISAFSDYISARPHDPYGPQCADIAELPEVQALIYTPLEEELNQKAFDHYLETCFDDFTSSWRASTEESLLKIMRTDIAEATIDDLWSPATMFSCKDCRVWFHTSCTFTHRCERRPRRTFGYRLPMLPTNPWEALFEFNHEAYLKASLTLQKMEPSPSTNMLSLQLFHCLDCSQSKGRRVITSWKEAIYGASSCINLEHSLQLATLTSEEERFKDLYVDMKLATTDQSRYIICARCREMVSTSDGKFEQHQTDRHEKPGDIWNEGTDFYRTTTILDDVRFAEDFDPDDTDVRTFIFRFAKKLRYNQFQIDLRTDSRFAVENYRYPGHN